MTMSQHGEKSPHLFVAIPIGVEIGTKLNAWAKLTFGECSFRRWSDPRDVHFTLKFLGSIEEARIAEMNAALREAFSRETPFALGLAGAATFGLPEAPRVLFAEPATGSERLSRLADATEKALAPLGFAQEKRSFRAHLTLARKYAADAPAFDPAKLGTAPALSVGTIDRAVLYRTHMNQRPMYEEVSSFPLSHTKDP